MPQFAHAGIPRVPGVQVHPQSGAGYAECAVMCACVEKVDELLKPHKSALVVSFPNQHVICRTDKTEHFRGKPAAVVAKYCPFCGEKYEQPTPA